jgi:hypothetical protein
MVSVGAVALFCVGSVGAAAVGDSQTKLPSAMSAPQALVHEVIENENAAAARQEHWEYLSNERSGRTGGHLWTERVVETTPGRVRMLIAVDGKPLSPEQMQAERARVEQIREHPDAFILHEKGVRVEEKRARDLMDVLPKDFLFEDVRLQDGIWRMNFRPNPDYVPNGIEERVLHGMEGTLVIDAKQLRLLHMDFHVVKEISIGFGLLADIHRGTNFMSDRAYVDGSWHTMHVATQVRAKAVLFKTVDLNVDLQRSDFKPVEHEMTVSQAAARLLNNRE